MRFSFKTFFGGMLAGALLLIAIEIILFVLLLHSAGVQNPFQFALSLPNILPSISSLNFNALKGIGNVSNILNIFGSNSKLSVDVTNVSISGRINVSAVTNPNSTLIGTLSYSSHSSGFAVPPGTVIDYTVAIPNYSGFPMHISNFWIGTQNFTIIGIAPSLPKTLKPNSTVNFTISIKSPSKKFNGVLNLFFNGTVSKN